MAQTFLFYDLETSGLNARDDRIMQFAGQRTTMDLAPIGDPINVLVKLNDDTLPSPEAIMVTKITPQSTLADGYTEAEFAAFLQEEVFTPDTIAVGYNNIRFDDEFIRHLFWRNFYDPYEWSWKDGRSRWDLLDVVRMTRALRPEGINWPVTEDGKATNRLELLTKINNISHEAAHDALSDVTALIDIAKLIRDRQPQLFGYLLKLRDKKAVQSLVNLEDKQPFVYVSGRYDQVFNKATVATPLTAAPNKNVIVYDLRYDPTTFINLSESELRERLTASWETRRSEGFVPIPIKVLQYNHCPAVAPVGVLSQADGWKKIGLDLATVEKHADLLHRAPGFAETIRSIIETESSKRTYSAADPESQLYDSFVNDPKDKIRIELIRNATPNLLADLHPEFQDERLPGLLLHYKARNYAASLSDDEQVMWEEWRGVRLEKKLPSYLASLKKIAEQELADRFILEELQLWAEAILPSSD